MSKFYMSASNNRSTITKCGYKDGLNIHARGWNKGIRVNIYYDEESDKEVYEVFETAGSNGMGSEVLITRIEY